MDNLATASQELGKALYEEAAKKQTALTETRAAAAGTAPEEGEVRRKKGPDDVIDAEFEAKDK